MDFKTCYCAILCKGAIEVKYSGAKLTPSELSPPTHRKTNSPDTF